MTLTRLTPAKLIATASLVATLAADTHGSADNHCLEPTEEATQQDLVLQGQIEYALGQNPFLSDAIIHAAVDGSTVMLGGIVDEEIEAQLARQVALTIDGIERVELDLRVAKLPETTQSQASDIEAATISAKVKMKLLASDYLPGRRIGVETSNRTVTLTGSVRSGQEKSLAEITALNTDGVAEVINRLQIPTL